MPLSQDISNTKKKIKAITKRYTEKTKTFEFLVKFQVVIEQSNDTSLAS